MVSFLDLNIPSSTVASSIKLSSSKSSNDFLINDVVILSLSAPGAEKLVNPLALSFKVGLISALIICSLRKSPTL